MIRFKKLELKLPQNLFNSLLCLVDPFKSSSQLCDISKYYTNW